MLSLVNMHLPLFMVISNQQGEYIRDIISSSYSIHLYSSGGVDVGDHPPITPMRSANRHQLRDNEWKLYDFITRHFLATVSYLPLHHHYIIVITSSYI